MQKGDMVCYNVGNMKTGWKTLGILLDVKRITEGVCGSSRGREHTFVKICWVRIGKYAPRPIDRHCLGFDTAFSGQLDFLPVTRGGICRAKVNMPQWFRNTAIEMCKIK